MRLILGITLLATSVFMSCDFTGGGGGGGTGTGQVADDNENVFEPSSEGISLSFNRVSGPGSLSSIEIIISISKNSEPVLNAKPVVSASKGNLSAVTELGNGLYRAQLDPDQTGEYPITVSYNGKSVSETPIVLYGVDNALGQPMSVSGFVNTAGYEDGVTVSPDGEYLFVQTGPHYFMGVFLMQASKANGGCGGAMNRLGAVDGSYTQCKHTWIDSLIGSYSAPERPGFFSARFSGAQLLHNSVSWDIGNNAAPNYAMSTMFYGFKRQEDGSFKEPFYLAFDDQGDGLINPYGMSFMMNGDGTATMTYTFDDPTDPDMVDFDGNGSDDAQSYFDVYTTQIELGKNNILGTFVPSGTPGTHPVRSTPFASQVVNFGKIGIEGLAGTQGNSHLFYNDAKQIQSVWVDDEFDSGGDHGEISVHVLQSGNFPNGSWSKVTLPSPINIAGESDEIQPFFTGESLLFTRSGTANPSIWYSLYSGEQNATDYAKSANWSTPVEILAHDPNLLVGNIVAVGEPTVADYKGKSYVYFVYGYIRGFDVASGLYDIDMQAGFVEVK